MTLRITVLGTGNSAGVPMANGEWGACDPAEPRNRRLRSSILIEREGTRVLVDAGPDVRQQLLAAKIDRLDAVVFTHDHADHTQGIDDLRPFSLFGRDALPIYGFPEVLQNIQKRFRYMFGGGTPGYYDTPALVPQETPPRFRIGAIELTLFEQDHTVCRTAGIRAGRFAYSTDVKNLAQDAFGALDGVEVWVIAAIRREPHMAHVHLAQVLEWIARVQPDQAYITHMNQTMDYRTLCAELPGGVAPAYDGLVIELNG